MFYKSIETVIVMLCLIGSGWLLSYKKWMNVESKKFINKLLINIAIPSLIITKFFESFPRDVLNASGRFIFIIAFSMSIILIISNLVLKFINIDSIRSGSFISMCVVSNNMTFGLPICLSLFGNSAIPFIMYYYIANTVIFWTVLSPRIMRDANVKQNNSFDNIKKIFNPPLITILTCIALIYLGFTPPTLLLKISKYFSDLVTPLASILVGRIIFEIDFKSFKIDISIIAIILMRFIISPTIMFIVTSFLKLPQLAILVFTLQSAMPVMMQINLVSELYGTDSKYVATAISLTTSLSLFFIPLYMIIIPLLFK